jgi:hypothetical protein
MKKETELQSINRIISDDCCVDSKCKKCYYYKSEHAKGGHIYVTCYPLKECIRINGKALLDSSGRGDITTTTIDVVKRIKKLKELQSL